MAILYELAACPACGAEATQELADGEALKRELEALWAFHTRRLHPATPPRALSDRLAFSQAPPLRLCRCTRCGTIFRNPRETAATLDALYRNEKLDPTAVRALFEAQRAACRAQVRRLGRITGRTGSGLEVGSYVGGFLHAAADAGWRFQGIDVNEDANAFARGLGLHVERATIEDVDPGRRYDAVAFWNCFDQLPDPHAAARAAARLLAHDGVLAVRVPNGAFYARLRPLLDGRFAPVARALLAHNNLLGFPYRHGFTPRSLARLLADVGLRVTNVVGDTLVRTADAHTRRWAAWEEAALKTILRRVSPAHRAPWFELYAVRDDRRLPAGNGRR
jgi:2-polyprenyl-3-methyl-5-hydroxy-6-metoxy-1,4-benzoquinol methylase